MIINIMIDMIKRIIILKESKKLFFLAPKK